ncbi:thioredoxin- transmembrane protein 4 [Desmophyllum pertusum]|uniref:Thioredoxin- transmembrane protein 4 n=1 Tax=Desmophyllum pertusum TaxID=174260 RepID=A0A9X0CI66_9CNID|nr:thioredoxin- transmembrane protein 4 [Desmophyllum pertusum]
MGCIGLTFKFSVLLKDLHELLTVTYGLPAWVSYTIFGVSTVLTGLLLGVGIVFLSDCIFGAPSYQSTQVPAQPLTKESDEKGSGEEDNDEEDEYEETEEKQENKTDESGVRKRVAATTD